MITDATAKSNAARDAAILTAGVAYDAGSRTLLNSALPERAQRAQWAKIMLGCSEDTHSDRVISVVGSTPGTPGTFGNLCFECAMDMIAAFPFFIKFQDLEPNMAERIAPLLAKALHRHATDAQLVERIAKGAALVLAGAVAPGSSAIEMQRDPFTLKPLEFFVQGSDGTAYSVTPQACTCADFTHRQQMCKHIVAVHFYTRLQA